MRLKLNVKSLIDGAEVSRLFANEPVDYRALPKKMGSQETELGVLCD